MSLYISDTFVLLFVQPKSRVQKMIYLLTTVARFSRSFIFSSVTLWHQMLHSTPQICFYKPRIIVSFCPDTVS